MFGKLFCNMQLHNFSNSLKLPDRFANMNEIWPLRPPLLFSVYVRNYVKSATKMRKEIYKIPGLGYDFVIYVGSFERI